MHNKNRLLIQYCCLIDQQNIQNNPEGGNINKGQYYGSRDKITEGDFDNIAQIFFNYITYENVTTGIIRITSTTF